MATIFEYDVFISFASTDEEIAKPIWQDLSLSGLRVFWSDQALKSSLGNSWFEVIQSSLEKSRHFLLICTPTSMSSKWVKREYEAFYNHCYRPGMRKLIPGLVGNYNVSDLPLFFKDLQACRLDNRESIKEIIRNLGGTGIEELKEALTIKEEENKQLKLKVEELVEIKKQKEDEITKLKEELAKAPNRPHIRSPIIPGKEIRPKSYDPDNYFGEIIFKDGKSLSYVWIRNSRGVNRPSQGETDQIAYADSLEVHTGKPGQRIFFNAISRIDFLDLTNEELKSAEEFKKVEKKEMGRNYQVPPPGAPAVLKGKILFHDGSVWNNVYLYPDNSVIYKSKITEGIITDRVKSITFNLKTKE